MLYSADFKVSYYKLVPSTAHLSFNFKAYKE